jgi:hypothetical protein
MRRSLRVPAAVAALAAFLLVSACGLTGVAAPGGALNTAALAASSTGVDFGDVTVGTSSAQPLTLTNTSNSNVSISSVAVTGGGFSASGGSAVTLTPNQSVTVYVNFNPIEMGQHQGEVSVADNASEDPLQIELSGMGSVRVRHSVALQWQRSPSRVSGYYVYRGVLPSVLLKLNGSPNLSTSFTDVSVVGGLTYYYAVTSVNSQNVESAQSNKVTVQIPSP